MSTANFALEDEHLTNPAEALVMDAIRAQVPVLLIGAPGTGKTAMLRSISRKMQCRLWVQLGSTMEPSEVTGQPVLDRDTKISVGGKVYPSLSQVPPRWSIEAAEHGGIVFWDELNTASPSTMAAMLTVILDKRVSELQLPCEKVAMVAAMNPVEMSAGGSELPPAMANRFEHIPYTVQPSRWAKHFRDGFASVNGQDTPPQDFTIPTIDETRLTHWRNMVSTYIERNPQSLLAYPQDAEKATGPWASPRTWDMFSRLMAVCDESNRILHGQYTLGNDIANAFFAWHVQQQVAIDPEEALANPRTFALPKQTDVRIAMTESIAEAIIGRIAEPNRNDRLIAGWQVVDRLIDNNAQDAARALAARLGKIHRNYGGTYKLISLPTTTLTKLGDPTLLIELLNG